MAMNYTLVTGDLASQLSQTPSNSKYVEPEGLPYTSDLAQSANCLYVYVENPSVRFQFNQTKAPVGSVEPKSFGTMIAMNNFRNTTSGVLIVYQDGSASWNFQTTPFVNMSNDIVV